MRMRHPFIALTLQGCRLLRKPTARMRNSSRCIDAQGWACFRTRPLKRRRSRLRFRSTGAHNRPTSTAFLLSSFFFAVGIFACGIAHRPRPTCAKIRPAIANAILLSPFSIQHIGESSIGV